MADVLLTSETFVKSISSISDNIAGKYLRPAIKEAQERGLKSILGSSLLDKLKELVEADTIGDDDNAAYKDLLDECQYYLAYRAIVDLANKVSYKIGNFGVVKSSDENLQIASEVEISRQQEFYQSKADSCCFELQGYILENYSSFPELTENDCLRIKAHLHSAASCGIFLGGARGKKITGRGR